MKPVTLIVSRDGCTAEWDVPSGRTSGWHSASARLGAPGNLVLNGHHNIHGRAFARVRELQPLDQIIVIGERRKMAYEVTERKLLLERGQPLAVRIQNAQWVMPTENKRLTLFTRWPTTDWISSACLRTPFQSLQQTLCVLIPGIRLERPAESSNRQVDLSPVTVHQTDVVGRARRKRIDLQRLLKRR